MRDLVIETATESLSLALFEDGALIGYSHEILGRGHAEQTIPRIASLPDGGRADRIYVDIGPGSFTGLRVGLAAAKALSFAWGAELYGFGALTVVAHMARTMPACPDEIFVANTGGHGELFWQIFDAKGMVPIAPPQSTPIADLAKSCTQPVIFGTGAQTLVTARGSGEAQIIHPDARSVSLLGPEHLSTSPRISYGRDADAKPLAETVAP